MVPPVDVSLKIEPLSHCVCCTMIAAPRGVVDMEVTSSYVSSVVEPQSVPSWIAVVLYILVEEAKFRGTECLVPPRVDNDPRLLAGMASPACLAVDKGGKILLCVVGTLSPSDSDYVGPVGLCGMLSPSDSDSVGHVGPDGTLSSSDHAGILFRTCWDTVPRVGPVGPCWPEWDAVPV